MKNYISNVSNLIKVRFQTRKLWWEFSSSPAPLYQRGLLMREVWLTKKTKDCDMSYLNKQTNIYFNIHLNQISELTETSKLIYSALFTQAYITSRNTELTAFTLSQKDLIATLKISERNVRDSIKQLKEFCLITTYLSKDKINTYFKINDPVSKEEITEFHKENLFEVKDGYAYNQIILIPSEIIQLDETPSIRLAIGELQFAWMDSKNKNKQYYNLCNIKQAEKVLFKNFTKTLRTIRSKGYIKYDVSYCGKFSGYKNIVFDFNTKQEENKIDLQKAPVAEAIKAEEETVEDIKSETEETKAPVAEAINAEKKPIIEFDYYYYYEDYEPSFEFDYYYDEDYEPKDTSEAQLAEASKAENKVDNVVKNKEEKMTDEEFDAILAAVDDSPITKAIISDESKAEDKVVLNKELEQLNSERKQIVIEMNNNPNKASIYYDKLIEIDEKIEKLNKKAA